MLLPSTNPLLSAVEMNSDWLMFFLLYPDSYIPPNTLTAHDSCFIACIAPADIRRARLKERSPEFSDAELEVRINQESIEGMLGSLDLVIDTTNITQEETGKRAVEFLSRFSV